MSAHSLMQLTVSIPELTTEHKGRSAMLMQLTRLSGSLVVSQVAQPLLPILKVPLTRQVLARALLEERKENMAMKIPIQNLQRPRYLIKLKATGDN